ncbi:probable LRR receptor-like serine/threonine-protein kinase [Tanacetum coccineum]
MNSCAIKGKPLVLPWGRTPRLNSGVRVSQILGFPNISLKSVSGPKWDPRRARIGLSSCLADLACLTDFRCLAEASFGSLPSVLLVLRNRRQTKYIQLLRTATDDFSAANKLGEGGFGPVYKGTLDDGRFIAEIATISAVQHRNLVKLYGCCIDGEKRLLVYEHLVNKSLDQALFGKKKLSLSWSTRFEISLGVARGLTYLHEESRIRVVHRDVKASNVLLDSEWNPMISDFGLAKLYDDKQRHMSTRVAGTIGYLAPEYAMRGHLTEKADVFGFGVVTLEIISVEGLIRIQVWMMIKYIFLNGRYRSIEPTGVITRPEYLTGFNFNDYTTFQTAPTTSGIDSSEPGSGCLVDQGVQVHGLILKNGLLYAGEECGVVDFVDAMVGYSDNARYLQDEYLSSFLHEIFERVCNQMVTEDELASLQSIIVKLNYFVDILDVMHGSSRSIVSMNILTIATSINDRIDDPAMVKLLFDVAQSLHDSLDFSSTKQDDNKQAERLIACFIDKVLLFVYDQVNHEISSVCAKLMETAKSCVGADDKYLLSTCHFVHKQSPVSVWGD